MAFDERRHQSSRTINADSYLNPFHNRNPKHTAVVDLLHSQSNAWALEALDCNIINGVESQSFLASLLEDLYFLKSQLESAFMDGFLLNGGFKLIFWSLLSSVIMTEIV